MRIAISLVKLQPTRIARSLYGNNYSFAALLIDGDLVAWGDPEAGGDLRDT